MPSLVKVEATGVVGDTILVVIVVRIQIIMVVTIIIVLVSILIPRAILTFNAISADIKEKTTTKEGKTREVRIDR